MHRLRTTWGARLVVALMVVSLLPAVVAPSAQAARRAAVLSYAGWLRAQLVAPAGEAFERALAVAQASDARSFDAFLHAFFDAYEALQPEARLAHAFWTHGDLSNEALLLQLRGRFYQRVGEAVLPRVTLSVAQGCASKVLSRMAQDLALPVKHPWQAAASMYAAGHPEPPPFVLAIRMLFSALPLGP